MGLFDFFMKKTLSKAEINSILQREWQLQKPIIDEIVISECEKLVNKDDLFICLETGLHKEFVTKVTLDLFIDNFGYEMGQIHGTSADVYNIASTRNQSVINSFLSKLDLLNRSHQFNDVARIKKCYEQISLRVCNVGRTRGNHNYSLFKDSIIRK